MAASSQPVADRIATSFVLFSLLGWLIFLPIDVFDLQLLPAPSPLVSILGAATSLAGYAIIVATMYQNPFLAPIVKDQSARGQTLVDTGLYGRIRHPFYLGFILFLPGVGLWLESTAGSLVSLMVLFAFVYPRIRVEERYLQESLPGYEDYMNRVPCRLIPRVW